MKSAFPEFAGIVDSDIPTYKVPGNLDRKFWTPEYVVELQIDRFRPNIVLGDVPSTENENKTPKMVAFEEDGWESFEIIDQSKVSLVASAFGKEAIGLGQGIYTLVRCGRCMVPNIDPTTGIRDAHVSLGYTAGSFC